MDPTARAHELIEVTEALTALIEQENELLQELRIKEIEHCNRKRPRFRAFTNSACEKLSRIPASSMLSRLKSAYVCAMPAKRSTDLRSGTPMPCAPP